MPNSERRANGCKSGLIGSKRLMGNLNFRREAEFKKSFWDKKMNEWRDEYLYAMLKSDWTKFNLNKGENKK